MVNNSQKRNRLITSINSIRSDNYTDMWRPLLKSFSWLSVYLTKKETDMRAFLSYKIFSITFLYPDLSMACIHTYRWMISYSYFLALKEDFQLYVYVNFSHKIDSFWFILNKYKNCIFLLLLFFPNNKKELSDIFMLPDFWLLKWTITFKCYE